MEIEVVMVAMARGCGGSCCGCGGGLLELPPELFDVVVLSARAPQDDV